MFTPAITASRTSSPRVMRAKASSTADRGPPFLYLSPLAEAITTGFTVLGASTVGAWAKPGRALAAATPAAVPAFTNSRRLILCAIRVILPTNIPAPTAPRPSRAGRAPCATRGCAAPAPNRRRWRGGPREPAGEGTAAPPPPRTRTAPGSGRGGRRPPRASPMGRGGEIDRHRQRRPGTARPDGHADGHGEASQVE